MTTAPGVNVVALIAMKIKWSNLGFIGSKTGSIIPNAFEASGEFIRSIQDRVAVVDERGDRGNHKCGTDTF